MHLYHSKWENKSSSCDRYEEELQMAHIRISYHLSSLWLHTQVMIHTFRCLMERKLGHPKLNENRLNIFWGHEWNSYPVHAPELLIFTMFLMIHAVSHAIHFGHMGCLHEIIRRLLGVAWRLFLRNPWESALGLWPVPGVCFPWPKVSWDRLQLTRYPNKDIIRTETVFLERKYSAWWNGLIQNIFLHPWIQHSLDKSRPRLEVIVSFNVESKSNIFSLQEYVICEKKILFHKHTCLPLLYANSQGWQLTPYCPFFAHEYGDGIRLLLSEGANLFYGIRDRGSFLSLKK